MSIYLDNAATTQLDREVFDEMTPYLLSNFGNPSSLHGHGRAVKKVVEASRRTIADLINALPNEIIFTSGGTEADNTAILSAIRSHGIKHIITTAFEHHAVLHLLEVLERNGEIKLSFIQHDERGNLNLNHLDDLLRYNSRSLVTVMHANNEIGNLNNIELIGEICKSRGALFHSDTVQTMGHYRHDLSKLKTHFLAASAHKFHGPKGVGFLYCRNGVEITQLLHGGSQERKLRAGTENIHGIVGLAKALEVTYRDIDQHHIYIETLKNRMITKLREQISDVEFNGNSAVSNLSLYTLLSVSLPNFDMAGGLLHYLDQNDISVSGGSACSAGSSSHVLTALKADPLRTTVRFSFSRFNTIAEIDHAVEKLSELYKAVAA
jgi:cysteine desulfurase